MPTTPTAITAAPAVPVSTDPEVSFDAMFEAFLAWLKNSAQPGIDSAASVTYANAVEAAAAATNATAQAAAAQATVGASVWASGSYAYGAAAWSPTNGRTYRRKSPGGASPTDPAADPTNWWEVSNYPAVPIVDVGTSGAATVGVHYRITASITLTLPATATQGDWVAYTNRSGTTTAAFDPGVGKVMGELGLHTIDNPFASGRLVFSGATDGWIYG